MLFSERSREWQGRDLRGTQLLLVEQTSPQNLEALVTKPCQSDRVLHHRGSASVGC